MCTYICTTGGRRRLLGGLGGTEKTEGCPSLPVLCVYVCVYIYIYTYSYLLKRRVLKHSFLL